MNDEIDIYWKVAFVVIIALALYEGVLVGIGFFMADKVECNWLYCTFTTTRKTIEQNTECFENGIKINCSDYNFDEHLCFNGTCSVNGVCSPDKNNQFYCGDDYW